MEQPDRDRLLILEERVRHLRHEMDTLMKQASSWEGYVKGALNSFNDDLVVTLKDVDERLDGMEHTLRGKAEAVGVVGKVAENSLCIKRHTEDLAKMQRYIWSVAIAFISAVIGFVFSLLKVAGT